MNKALLIVCSLLTLSAAPAFADGNAQAGLVVSKSANPAGAIQSSSPRGLNASMSCCCTLGGTAS